MIALDPDPPARRAAVRNGKNIFSFAPVSFLDSRLEKPAGCRLPMTVKTVANPRNRELARNCA